MRLIAVSIDQAHHINKVKPFPYTLIVDGNGKIVYKHSGYNYMALVTLLLLSVPIQAQQEGMSVSGSIQSDVLIPQSDEKIGAEKSKDWGLTNSYADIRGSAVVG